MADAIEPPPLTRWRRRRVLGWPMGALFLLCAGALRAQPSRGDSAVGSAVSAPRDRATFAARALALRDEAVRRGDQPYGAVVVRKGEIVGEGVSAVITDRDPTAHAEMVAIRAAARRLGSRDLGECELFGSSRACPMCEAAAYWANIGRMFHGSEAVDAGPPRLRG
jgi:tRNA(Arg) A34 adenosine deaminase TadA